MRHAAKTPMKSQQPEGKGEKIEPLLMQGPGTMLPMTAATRSGSTLLAGPTRAREPECVWGWPTGYGLAAEICPQARLRCTSLSTKLPYQIVIMPSSYNELTRKPLLLRHSPKPSLRNHIDGRDGLQQLRQEGGTCWYQGPDAACSEDISCGPPVLFRPTSATAPSSCAAISVAQGLARRLRSLRFRLCSC